MDHDQLMTLTGQFMKDALFAERMGGDAARCMLNPHIGLNEARACYFAKRAAHFGRLALAGREALKQLKVTQ